MNKNLKFGLVFLFLLVLMPFAFAGTITAYDVTNSDLLNNFTVSLFNTFDYSTINGTVNFPTYKPYDNLARYLFNQTNGVNNTGGVTDEEGTYNGTYYGRTFNNGDKLGTVTIEDNFISFGSAGRFNLSTRTYDLSKNVSFSFWIQRNNPDTNVRYMFTSYSGSGVSNVIKYDSFNKGLTLASATNYDECYATDSRFDGTDLNHVTITVNNYVCQFYINGVAIPMNDSIITNNITIDRLGSSTNSFNGKMTGILIYNKSVNSSEITEIYNAGKDAYSPVNSGLVAQYSGRDYAGTAGSPTSIYDTNHLTNAPTTALRGSFAFDGVNDRVYIGNTSGGSSAGSVSFWSKIDSSQTPNAWTFGQRYTLKFTFHQDYTSFGLGNSTCASSFGCQGSILGGANAYGEWKHVVGTWEVGDVHRLYVNGVNVANGTLNLNSPLRASTDLYAGGPSYSSEYWNGSLADVRIYNYSLSDLEVQALYNNYPADLLNFTVQATGFYNESYTDINYTSAIQTNLTQVTSIGARDFYTNATLNLNTSVVNASNGILYNANQVENSNSSRVYLWTESTNTSLNISYPNYYTSSSSWDLSEGGSDLLASLIPYPYIFINATNLVNNTPISSFNSTVYNSSGSLVGTYSTTNGTILLQLPIDVYNVSFDSSDYEYQTALVNATGYSVTQTFLVYTTNSVYITFRNSITNSLVPGNISVEFVSDLISYNYTTANSTLYADLLSPTSYTVRSTVTNYDQNLYYFTLINRTYNNFTIYLTNSTDTTDVTIKVLDSVDNQPLQDYIVKVLKYNPGTNTYITSEILQTNFEGEVVADILLASEFYRFIIENPDGEVIESTDPTYIYKTSLTILVNTAGEILQNYDDLLGLSAVLEYNNATQSFRLTYSDSYNTINQMCLKLQMVQGVRTTYYDDVCATTSSGIILQNISSTNGTYWIASAYVTYDSDEMFVTSLSKNFPAASLSDINWYFYAFILTIAISLLLLWSPMLMVMAIPTPSLVLSAVGVLPIELPILVGLQLVFILLGSYLGAKMK